MTEIQEKLISLAEAEYRDFMAKLLPNVPKERVLGVPGSGFGCPGFFRLAFCVDEKVIRNSADGFAKARAKFA